MEKTSQSSKVSTLVIPADGADPLASRPPKMPPTRGKSSSAANNNAPNDKTEEEEDRHAVEVLRRLEDLGVQMPSQNVSPETLRNHRFDPESFVAIASQLAAIIEPLIEMTGADNPSLARRSCETIMTLGAGTSEEDRASRALGALAVLAVGQMYCIQFSNLEKRLVVVVVVRFSSRQRGKTVPVVVVFLFSSTSISTKVSRLRALSDAFYSPRLITMIPLPSFPIASYTDDARRAISRQNRDVSRV